MRTTRLLVAAFAFWAITATALYAGTFVHEYSHYAAHEGFNPPEVRFYDTPEEARAELVAVETVEHAGRQYRMENVPATTIVLYDDALLYAMSLNLLPSGFYETGSLGATFLHAGPEDTHSIVQGVADTHWSGVMAAPLIVSIALLASFSSWMILRPSLLARSLFVAYAAEVGNNAHHAPAIGLDSMSYAIVAEVVFGLALVTAFLLSPTYRRILDHAGTGELVVDDEGQPAPAQAPAAGPAGSVRFRHVRGGPPTPGRAAPRVNHSWRP